MDAAQLFSKIIYLEEGMNMLLAQGPVISSEDLKTLLAAAESKTNPVTELDAERFTMAVIPELIAKMPVFNAASVARQLGPVLTAGLPTPDTLRAAGIEAADTINQEFTRLDRRFSSLLTQMEDRMLEMEKRIEESVDRLPSTVGLDAFYDPKVFLLFLLLPILCVFGIMVHSLTTRVSKEQFEHLQERSVLLKKQNDLMNDADAFYFTQIKEYKRKFPKAAGYFPDYRSVTLVQPVEPAAQ